MSYASSASKTRVVLAYRVPCHHTLHTPTFRMYFVEADGKKRNCTPLIQLRLNIFRFRKVLAPLPVASKQFPCSIYRLDGCSVFVGVEKKESSRYHIGLSVSVHHSGIQICVYVNAPLRWMPHSGDGVRLFFFGSFLFLFLTKRKLRMITHRRP